MKTTYMNDVMRAVVCIPGLFSLLEWFPPVHSQRTLYRHAEYATEHTEAYVFFLRSLSRESTPSFENWLDVFQPP